MTVESSDANHPYRRTRALITAEEIEAKAIELAGIPRLEFLAHDTWFRNAYREQARVKLLQPVLKDRAARQPRDSRGRFQKASKPRQSIVHRYYVAGYEVSESEFERVGKLPNPPPLRITGSLAFADEKTEELSAALDAVGDHDSRIWSENVAACRCDQAPWWRAILKWMGW